jgi:hypothetical protein
LRGKRIKTIDVDDCDDVNIPERTRREKNKEERNMKQKVNK